MPDRWELPGSHRSTPPGVETGTVDPQAQATVTVLLRSKHSASPPPGHLSREEFASLYGAGESDMERVETFAREHNLRVDAREPGPRRLQLTGRLEDLERAFGASLRMYRDGDVTYRGRSGSLSLPPEMADVVVAVLGLDSRPQARAHHRVAAAPAASYTPPQIAQLYDFPAGVTGAGETVGIIELGGGYNASDFSTYCSQLGITAPGVSVVTIDGATNNPGADQNADTEVMLDIDVAGTIAPGAKFVIYFAPNTDQGFTDAIASAVHDTTNKPTVLSISWGGPESTWTPQAIAALDQACAAGVAMGITICVASGDNGSTDGVTDGAQHVDFPASSANVLACGGTTIDGTSGNAIAGEVAWSGSGGGVSGVFPLPSWQSTARVPSNGASGGRGVPDVSGDADPDSGYAVLVDGSQTVVGGTSAVAPLWAALVALINEKTGTTAGLINPRLYALSGDAIVDITSGSNGAYSAGPGWDPVTGLGRPDGAKLISALS